MGSEPIRFGTESLESTSVEEKIGFCSLQRTGFHHDSSNEITHENQS